MTALLAVLLLGAGAIFLARCGDTLTGGRARSPVPQLAAFTPWTVPVWLAVGVLALIAGEREYLLVAGLAGLTLTVWAAPGRSRRPVPAAGDQPLTLVTLNALIGRADRTALVGLVARVGADVVVIEELTEQLAGDLAEPLRAAGLVHDDLHPGHHGVGTGIWSRWPLTPLDLLPSSRCAMPRVLVHPKRGEPVTVTGVHTQSPNLRLLPGWRADLALLARVAAEASGHQVFAGDFNASRDHVGFRRILRAGLVDAVDVTRRPAFTWPAHLLPVSRRRCLAATRLDHVLVSAGIRVGGVELVRVPRSDHKAVVARLGLPGSSPVAPRLRPAGARRLGTWSLLLVRWSGSL